MSPHPTESEMPRAYSIEEEDPPVCAFCEAVEVANAGDFCSDECEALDRCADPLDTAEEAALEV